MKTSALKGAISAIGAGSHRFVIAGLVTGLLLTCGGFLLSLPARAAPSLTVDAAPLRAPELFAGVFFTKTVTTAAAFATDANACASSSASAIVVTAGTSLYYCYTITNQSGGPISLLTLFDDDGAIVVNFAPGQVLGDGQTLLPTVTNGLARPFTVPAGSAPSGPPIVSRAQWTVERDGVINLLESTTTIRVAQVDLAVTLGVGGVSTGCNAATNANIPVTNDRYGIANYCLTLTNRGGITLAEHTIAIPALNISGKLTADLPPTSLAPSAKIEITRGGITLFPSGPTLSAAWTAPMSETVQHTLRTVSVVVTSTAQSAPLVAAVGRAAVTVSGPSATILVNRYFADRPDRCSRDLNDAGPPGTRTYYCVVIQNTSATSATNPIVPLTTHELYDSATRGRVVIQIPGESTLASTQRLTITNDLLARWQLPQILGPVVYPQPGMFQSTSVVTSTNAEFGYLAASTSNLTNLTITTPRPEDPTPTNTPWPTFTPPPTWTPIPIPPTFTIEPTWTPAPTWTPSPTVVIITTPGGIPPTPYPEIGLGGLVTPTPNPFVQPPGVLDPVAQTATAAVLFGFVTPSDPFVQTATAQALFGVGPADPVAQTATAAVLFGFVTPSDPFVQTATAQALFGAAPADAVAQTATAAVLFGFVTPSDPFVQTATAQALFGAVPADAVAQTATAAVLFGFVTPSDPFVQTATAQALFGAATATPALAPETPPTATPLAVAALPPPITVITITATPAPGALAAALRPIEQATPLPNDAAALFRAIAGGAATSLMLIGILGGVVLFLLLAGVLAGVSVGNPGPPKYDLVDTAGEDASPQPDLFAPRPPAPPVSAANDEEWPASLP